MQQYLGNEISTNELLEKWAEISCQSVPASTNGPEGFNVTQIVYERMPDLSASVDWSIPEQAHAFEIREVMVSYQLDMLTDEALEAWWEENRHHNISDWLA